MEYSREQYEQWQERHERLKEEFAHEIPFNELFAKISQLTGLNDLKFSVKFVNGREGLRPEFESQDLVDKVGFLKLIFSSIKITSFNSAIAIDKPRNYDDIDYTKTYPIYYWCTVDFSYEHPGGGSNGKTFLTAWYQDNQWQYRLEGER